MVVIHDMEYPEREKSAEWCANYFAGQDGTRQMPSAHYCIDAGEIIQGVKETDGAWHTPGSLPNKQGREINRTSIGIEHAGYAKQTKEEWFDEYSKAMLERSAGLVADICIRHKIPVVKLSPADLLAGKHGITGHGDCTKATGVGDHSDPGPNFPWDWYIERVQTYYDAMNGIPAPRGADVPLVQKPTNETPSLFSMKTVGIASVVGLGIWFGKRL